ncbi:type I polyketide synthase [Brevibacillus antibioticus]|uniref:type I polyketide synthase n=1 Tax=Brevibacillus antibioticus TaxID=2570228 RepID=UPI00138FDCF0|nr:SDR family oxidoreductase [Brevibacillus antibioticus]
MDFLSISVDQILQNSQTQIDEIQDKDIAVIGISLRFPMADTVQQFWNNIRNGVDCVQAIPAARRKDVDNLLRHLNKLHPSLSYAKGAYLDRIDTFDHTFFKISPNEARLIDPNQRIFLETAWSVLEDAGYGGDSLAGTRTGIYLGYGSDGDYKRYIAEIEPESIALATTGNVRPLIASRLSHIMNFRGPSMIVDTTCSSSLTAVHLACQAIRSGECEQAIAGGVQIHLIPVRNVEIGIESSTGHTRTFDDSSDGTGTGEGAACVLLKPLHKALRDGDHIYAVIKGSAVNHDGTSASLSAPNATAQEDVMINAWRKADFDPETITYMEAHGTGTKLGDPIEIDGIKRAFSKFTDKRQFCAIGSVKSNIGHLDNSAGIAGLLKAILALTHQELPPTLHFTRPNRNVSFEDSPVYVNDCLTKWHVNDHPRRCGISSFGISGTNCHIVLEEAPPKMHITNSEPCPTWQVLTLSAKTEEVLLTLVNRYRDVLTETDNRLEDICYTANTGRGHDAHRLGIPVRSLEQLQSALATISSVGLTEETLKTQGIWYGSHRMLLNEHEQREGRTLTEERMQMLSAKANAAVHQWLQSGKLDQDLLHKWLDLYIDGAKLDFGALFTEKKYYKIPLPTYPFAKTRCWLKVGTSSQSNAKLFYESIWKQKDLPMGTPSIGDGSVLIWKDEMGIGSQVSRLLQHQQIRVIEAEFGEQFRKRSDNTFEVRSDSLDDYHRLFQELKDVQISQILHFASITADCEAKTIDQLNVHLKKGVIGLFYLVKALGNQMNRNPLKLTLISQNVYEVTGSESYLRPESAALFGLGKAAHLELPELTFRCIDIEEDASVELLVHELRLSTQDFIVALRDGARYVEEINELDASTCGRDRDVKIKENGVYLITGGLGKIGLAFAKHLATRQHVHLVLIGRTRLPERGLWEQVVRSGEKTESTNKIKELQSLEQAGATVAYYPCDVASETELEATLQLIRERFGKIDGIFHCAGIGSRMQGSPIKTESIDIFQNVIAPKIQGTWLLNQLTIQDKLDFFYSFSSSITIVGGIGSSHYTAANSYLDAFSHARNKYGMRALALGWAAWGEDGILDNHKHLFQMLSDQDGIEAFEQIMDIKKSRVIVGRMNYSSSLFEIGEYLPFRLSDQLYTTVYNHRLSNQDQFPTTAVKTNVKDEVKLIGVPSDSFGEVELQIAQIWQEVLGFEEFHLYDNFFEIGGDSIMITKVHASLERIYPGKVVIGDLFSHPSISKLAAYIRAKEGVQRPKDRKEKKEPEKSADLTGDISDLLINIKRGKISIESAVKSFQSLEGQS